MNNLQVFENNEFGKVRIIVMNGEPWFVGKDVADVLGYSNTRDAIAKHVDEVDKNTVAICDGKGNPNQVIINESGVYSLIFSSKLPNARMFKRWVTSDILPTIRKHGAYMTPDVLDKVIQSPEFGIKLLTALKDEKEARVKAEAEAAKKEQALNEMNGKVAILDQQLCELKPKADYYDSILKSKKTVTTTQIAADYGMSAIAFNAKLKELKVQYKIGGQWVLYANYKGCGYTHTYFIDKTKDGVVVDQIPNTQWTQKGRLFLYNFLKKHDIVPAIEREGA